MSPILAEITASFTGAILLGVCWLRSRGGHSRFLAGWGTLIAGVLAAQEGRDGANFSGGASGVIFGDLEAS